MEKYTLLYLTFFTSYLDFDFYFDFNSAFCLYYEAE